MNHLIGPLRSWYSFRSGVVPPAELAAGLAEKGFTGGVLADSGVMSGMLEFSSACGEQGVTGAAGVRLEVNGSDVMFAAREGGWGQMCALATSVAAKTAAMALRVYPKVLSKCG